MNDKNEDTKERLNRIEGQAIGHLGAKTEGKDSNSFTVAVIAVIVAFLAIAVSVILHFSGR